ncbi:MAG: HDIG domain-containing protein [bacterium]|nr:HDIG domain-containing protein [bacterium]
MASLKLAQPITEWVEKSKLLPLIWPETAQRQKLLGKFLLLLILSVLITGLISPRVVLQAELYQEGDIIRANIVIPEDMLLPDQVSTNLKGDKLVKELGAVYDYDPNLFARTIGRIQTAFEGARNENAQIADLVVHTKRKRHDLGAGYFRLHRNLQETNRKARFYGQFQRLLQARLQSLSGQTQLSANNFVRKSKLDADLQAVGRILGGLKENQQRDQKGLKSYPETFREIQKELTAAAEVIEQRRQSMAGNFLNALGIDPSEVDPVSLSFDFTSIDFERDLIALLTGVQNRQIIASKVELNGIDGKVALRNLVTSGDEPFSSPDQFLLLSEARDLLRQHGSEIFTSDESGNKRNLAVILAQKLLRPTITPNKLELEKRKDQLVAEMSPVYFSVKKSEVIARAGDRATAHQVEMIQSYYEEMAKGNKWPKMLGNLLIVLFLLVLVYFVLQLKGGGRVSFKSLLLIAVAVVSTMLLVKGGAIVSDLIAMRYTEMDTEVYRYLFPVALTSMLVGILINFEAALLSGLLTSLLVTVMLQGNLYYFFFSIVGSMIASLPMTKFDSRHSLLNHGLKVSVVSMPVLLIIMLIEKNGLGGWSLPYFVSGALGGVMAAVVASVLLPAFEAIFDVTTNLRLLELSNMNHPALKNLIFRAPGTYQHSILVGNLSEAAATKIGANPLLARVGAYYHDLGKGEDSHYFIENQPANSTNIHDEMDDPYASAAKIIGHLTEGSALAVKHRLGSLIRDMIVQHHGRSLVRYFYEKANRMAAELGRESPIDDEPFRYPGPKPQSLEAALIMLADAAEASTRSIEKPTEELIARMVEKVGWGILKDGQLDESGMTLEMFRDTLDCFAQVLRSVHHHRIQYPDEVGLVTSRHRASF